jgi:hypothetical protein
MIFEMKRRQRIIPVIRPLANTTVEFIHTIGNLYFQSGAHKNIAEKKINFFMDQLRSKYWVNTSHLDESFATTLSKKTGKSEEESRSLVRFLNLVRSKDVITAEELMELNKRIERFHL